MKKILLLIILCLGLAALQAQTFCDCGRDYDIFDSLLKPKQELLDSLTKAGACFESDYSEVRINTSQGKIKINYKYGIAERLDWVNPPFTYRDIEHVLLNNYYLAKNKGVYKLHILRDINAFHFYLSWETYVK